MNWPPPVQVLQEEDSSIPHVLLSSEKLISKTAFLSQVRATLRDARLAYLRSDSGMIISDFQEKFDEKLENEIILVKIAYEIAFEFHSKQPARHNGDPDFSHPLTVALTALQKFPNPSGVSIAMHLLHDVVEDSRNLSDDKKITIETLRATFHAKVRAYSVVTHASEPDFHEFDRPIAQICEWVACLTKPEKEEVLNHETFTVLAVPFKLEELISIIQDQVAMICPLGIKSTRPVLTLLREERDRIYHKQLLSSLDPVVRYGVLTGKLSDRFVNLRTAKHYCIEKRIEIVFETIRDYLPIARALDESIFQCLTTELYALSFDFSDRLQQGIKKTINEIDRQNPGLFLVFPELQIEALEAQFATAL